MGRAKKVKKFAAVKRMINPNDPRLYVDIYGMLVLEFQAVFSVCDLTKLTACPFDW